ncbi:MAG TPA: response regulator transcription factor [Kofleriaceae bacterium]|nr:response regulator transcription factor [Kofleriaceae bacterium]
MRLLVIEDHSLLRESLVRGLRDLGYAVDATGDGNDGLAFAREHQYDAIVLDIMLPGIDGLEVLRRLREHGDRVPILLLTARSSVEDRVAGLDRGADDYLVKPFAFDELAARLRALVRRRYDRAHPVVRIADLEIDPGHGAVRRAGRSVLLSARELALLEYLASRQGEVVSRADILQHLYDASGEPWSNVLDVYISHLRRKIDDGHDRKLIHTRRGLGYVLGEDE